jgi:hypothetical protein
MTTESTIKALSISQPWASLVIMGVKRLETRPWQTRYRGPLAIHASKNFSRAARMLCLQEPCRSALQSAGVDVWSRLPCGVILGVVELVDCVRVEEFGEVPADELSLGDFRPGRWVWRFENPKLLPAKITYRGQLGVFDVPDDIFNSTPHCASRRDASY